MEALREAWDAGLADRPSKIILSKPGKAQTYKKIVLVRKKDYYQMEQYTDKQVFHRNVAPDALTDTVYPLLEGSYGQCNILGSRYEHVFLVSKKGTVTCRRIARANACSDTDASSIASHNRQKHYLLEEGTIIPPLVDMGVFTREGKVARSLYDKYKQINRFVAIIDDEVKKQKLTHLSVIDFGCGKSYLTFILYYYFTQIRKLPVDMIGLDLKEDVIRHCNEAAAKYGYEHLHFELGDINGYTCDTPVDMVITLHACDTATDYALYNAICWNARMIFSVPCCQHEVNAGMKPANLELFSHYGIIKERMSALLTDAVRANLLELCGYKTQVLEFIDFAHTPKNLLIRAVKRPTTPKSTLLSCKKEVDCALSEFQVQPTLYRLLKENGRI